MAVTLAFDVYGTLIDTHGVVAALQSLVGPKAQEFSQTWRDKQLEYSFRRGLMQNYVDFAGCTRHALDYACTQYKVDPDAKQRNTLLALYRVLPAFADVKEALQQLRSTDFRLFAFSNGSADAVEELLTAAGIRDYFLGIVSTDDLKSFKPDPAVYSHFLRKAGATGQSAWLVSSNPFDVIGAISAGMKSAWVQRSPESIFDPWEIQPTLVVNSLTELSQQITEREAPKS